MISSSHPQKTPGPVMALMSRATCTVNVRPAHMARVPAWRLLRKLRINVVSRWPSTLGLPDGIYCIHFFVFIYSYILSKSAHVLHMCCMSVCIYIYIHTFFFTFRVAKGRASANVLEDRSVDPAPLLHICASSTRTTQAPGTYAQSGASHRHFT